MLNLKTALIYIFFISLVTFSTRIFPFLLFKDKKPSSTIVLLEKYIPPAIMMLLLIYCLKNISISIKPYGFPEFFGVIIASVVQYKLKNPLISIFGATGIYMILIRLI